MGVEIRNNNYVGKKKETHNIVGLGAIGLWIDLKFFHIVRDNSLCGLEKSCGFGHIAAGIFEGIDDQLFLVVLNCPFEGEGRDCTGLFSGLKSRREMVAVDHPVPAEKDRSLYTIL